jgi:hypothetical protein
VTSTSLRVAAKRAESKFDENSNRRGERCDRQAAGSSPESEPACDIRTYATARFRTVEGNWRGVIADALDAVAVKTAVGRIQPDAVINELTSLPGRYTPAEMKAAAEREQSPSGRQHQPACGDLR